MSDENIERLRELTQRLPSIPEGPFAFEKEMSDEVREGSSYKQILLDQEIVEVNDIFMSKDTIFNGNSYPRKIVLAVYKGKIDVRYCKNERNKIVRAGEFVYFDPCKRYSIKVLEDTWAVSINIPMSGECKHGEWLE